MRYFILCCHVFFLHLRSENIHKFVFVDFSISVRIGFFHDVFCVLLRHTAVDGLKSDHHFFNRNTPIPILVKSMEQLVHFFGQNVIELRWHHRLSMLLLLWEICRVPVHVVNGCSISSSLISWRSWSKSCLLVVWRVLLLVLHLVLWLVLVWFVNQIEFGNKVSKVYSLCGFVFKLSKHRLQELTILLLHVFAVRPEQVHELFVRHLRLTDRSLNLSEVSFEDLPQPERHILQSSLVGWFFIRLHNLELILEFVKLLRTKQSLHHVQVDKSAILLVNRAYAL